MNLALSNHVPSAEPTTVLRGPASCTPPPSETTSDPYKDPTNDTYRGFTDLGQTCRASGSLGARKQNARETVSGSCFPDVYLVLLSL